MSETDENEIYSAKIRVENKDIFVDVKKNDKGTYLKISERKRDKGRNTILIPASGLEALREVLGDALTALNPPAPAKGRGKRERKEKKAPVAAAEPAPADPNSIFVNGLTWETTDDEFLAHFNSVGKIVSGSISRRPARRGGESRSMGFGTIEFATTAQAELAIERFNGTEFNGRTLLVRENRPKPAAGGDDEAASATERAPRAPRPPRKPREEQEPDTKRIFAANLPASATQDSISGLFGEAGHVISVDVRSGRRRGERGRSAIVQFAEDSATAKAISDFNGREWEGNAIIVRQYFLE